MGAKKRRSKKQSAASSKQPDSQVFFLDRSLGREIVANSLREAGAEVRVHSDYFADDAPDDEWLREVGKRGWLALTKDKRIRYRAMEFDAVVEAKVRLFVLTAGNLTALEMGKIFVKALGAMSRIALQRKPPFVARVTKGGNVSIIEIERSEVAPNDK